MKLYQTDELRASKKWPYAISAGCVVYRFNKNVPEVLLLVRKAGDFPMLKDDNQDTYHMPKGHIYNSESLGAAAERETEEEAGVRVEIQTYLGSTLNVYKSRGVSQHKTTHYFAGLWQKDLPSMDNEHSAKIWVSLGEAIQLLGSKNPKQEYTKINALQKFLSLNFKAGE